MWKAYFEFDNATVKSVSLSKSPAEGLPFLQDQSIQKLAVKLPEWAQELLDEDSLSHLEESRLRSSTLKLTIETAKYATVAIHLRDDTSGDDTLARGSAGPEGVFETDYDYDYEDPPIIIVSIIASGHKPYRLEMTLPKESFYCRPYLAREVR